MANNLPPKLDDQAWRNPGFFVNRNIMALLPSEFKTKPFMYTETESHSYLTVHSEVLTYGKKIMTSTETYTAVKETKDEIHCEQPCADSIEDTGLPVINEEDDDVNIPEFHPGTVDNPFLYDATYAQLQKFLLTIIFVAGKNATIQQKKLDDFLQLVRDELGSDAVDAAGVFTSIHNCIPDKDIKEKITGWLQTVKSGQYTRIAESIMCLGQRITDRRLDLKSCTRANLVALRGMGYKSASMFLMYTRKGWGGACLDTHVMKYIREELHVETAPVGTPPTKELYVRYENLFLQHAKALNKPVPELDFEIWSKYRVK